MSEWFPDFCLPILGVIQIVTRPPQRLPGVQLGSTTATAERIALYAVGYYTTRKIYKIFLRFSWGYEEFNVPIGGNGTFSRHAAIRRASRRLYI